MYIVILLLHRLYDHGAGMGDCSANCNWLTCAGSNHPGCYQAHLGATG